MVKTVCKECHNAMMLGKLANNDPYHKAFQATLKVIPDNGWGLVRNLVDNVAGFATCERCGTENFYDAVRVELFCLYL